MRHSVTQGGRRISRQKWSMGGIELIKKINRNKSGRVERRGLEEWRPDIGKQSWREIPAIVCNYSPLRDLNIFW
jgi:hypothetical protein